MAEIIKQIIPSKDFKNNNHRPKDYTYFVRDGYNVYGHPDMIITCSKCNETKNQKHFGIRWSDQYGIRDLRNICYPCKRYDNNIITKIRRTLNTSPPEVCDICKRSNSNKKMQIDHNHHTEKFRGFLCNSCNSSIGKFNDDPFMVIKVIKYLMKDGYYDKREISLKLKALASELDNV